MKLTSRKHFWPTISLIGLDVLMFAAIDVNKASPLLLMAGFLLLTANIFYAAYGILSLPSLYGLTIKRKRSLALYMTLIIGGLVALQSIGQLSQRDILVLSPLVIIGYMYNAYAKSSRRNLAG